MNAAARIARRTVKARSNETRTARRCVKAVATGTPQPAKTHLIAVGLPTHTAKRFAGAFSTKVDPTAVGSAEIKLKGRRTKTVPVKLYSTPAFASRLAAYRPRDTGAAALFEQAAHRLAA